MVFILSRVRLPGGDLRLKMRRQTCHPCHIEEQPNCRQKFVHGPVNSGDCLPCHEMHSFEHTFLLTGETKVDCDGSLQQRPCVDHPVAKNPVFSNLDPTRPDRETSCTGVNQKLCFQFAASVIKSERSTYTIGYAQVPERKTGLELSSFGKYNSIR